MQSIVSDTSVCVDWLQGTFKFPSYAEFELFFDDLLLFEDRFVLQPKTIFKGKLYKNVRKSTLGALVAYNFPDDRGIIDCWFSLNAEFLRSVPSRHLYRFIYLLFAVHGAKFTRLDTALDDYSKSISKEILQQAIEAGNFVGFENYNLNNSRKNKVKGFCFYLGSRESDKFMRIYDKCAQSGGVIDSYRFEVENKNERAQYVAQHISNAFYCDSFSDDTDEAFNPSINDVLMNSVLSAVNFVDRAADSNISRCPRLVWWSDFLLYCRTVPKAIKLPKPVPTLQKTFDWIAKQVETSIAMAYEFLGDEFNDWIFATLQSGLERLTPSHMAVVQVASSQVVDTCRTFAV